MDTLLINNRGSIGKRSFYSLASGDKFVSVKEKGFTLLELLAVVVIIGIVISIASLSIGQKNSHVVRDEAERLNGLLRLASEEAVTQGREFALQFSKISYSFLELDAGNQWAPITEDELLHERKFPAELKIDLVVEGAEASFNDEKNLPRVFILSSGELTPFKLNLSLDKEQYTLQGDLDGKLMMKKALDDEQDV